MSTLNRFLFGGFNRFHFLFSSGGLFGERGVVGKARILKLFIANLILDGREDVPFCTMRSWSDCGKDRSYLPPRQPFPAGSLHSPTYRFPDYPARRSYITYLPFYNLPVSKIVFCIFFLAVSPRTALEGLLRYLKHKARYTHDAKSNR